MLSANGVTVRFGKRILFEDVNIRFGKGNCYGIIGAINWGLIGLFRFNLVELLFGDMTVLARIVYSLVGISGLWGIKLLLDDE